ncbi:MAG TPA: dihydrolipoamide acetyltransferase family protein [Mycobacteriales bacterium]|nr:dihydrolipoamide acetyltransferase family protein [Mycobacteriales bacterium]
MGEFVMPSLGADMTEGTLLEWLVKPGDTVHRGDIVAVVDTDKAAIEVECFEDGVVADLLVAPGTKVAVGTPLAQLGDEAALPASRPVVTAPTVPEAPAAEAAMPPKPEPVVASPLVRHLAHTAGVDLSSVPGSGPDGVVTRSDVEAARVDVPLPRPATPAPSRRVRSSPLARRRAEELGVDITQIAGTGPDGSVTVADVNRTTTAVRTAPTASVPVEKPATDRNAAMRRAIGELMARSKREIPHYYVTTTIDLSTALSWMRDVNATRPVSQRLVPAALLLKASAMAARAVPSLNGTWADDHLEAADHVHLGVAVSLRPSGLVAPAILDADTLDLDTLMERLRDVVTRARSGRLRRTEMTEGTITVTNLGENGAESVLGVIFPPQVALVGLGRIVERPWASNGMLAVRPTVTATLSGDHRATDGHAGSRYLAALDDLLQTPEKL